MCISCCQSADHYQNINVTDKSKTVTKLTYLELTITNKTMKVTVWWHVTLSRLVDRYPLFNKNQAAWNFLSPELEVTWRAVAIIIRVILLSPYLCIHDVSLSPIYYKYSRRVYISQRHQYVRLIWSYSMN